MNQEIEKQRAQVLKDEEYLQYKLQWREKGIKRIPLFVASDDVLNTWYSLVNIKRITSSLCLTYGFLSAMTLSSVKLAAFSTFIYSSTGILVIMNIAYLVMFKRFMKNIVSNIDWDCMQEEFIITRPEGTFKVRMQDYTLNLIDIKMDPK